MVPSATPSSPGDGTPLQSLSGSALPKSIKSIREILDEKVAPNQLIDIIGLVRDFRPPVITGGTGMLTSAPSLVIRVVERPRTRRFQHPQ